MSQGRAVRGDFMKAGMQMIAALLGLAGLAAPCGAFAQETTAYEYDAAGNRKVVRVNGAANGSDPGGGASVPQTGFVVVPLNGFTITPFRR